MHLWFLCVYLKDLWVCRVRGSKDWADLWDSFVDNICKPWFQGILIQQYGGSLWADSKTFYVRVICLEHRLPHMLVILAGTLEFCSVFHSFLWSILVLQHTRQGGWSTGDFHIVLLSLGYVEADAQQVGKYDTKFRMGGSAWLCGIPKFKDWLLGSWDQMEKMKHWKEERLLCFMLRLVKLSGRSRPQLS